ncbi:MAG: hypothetical protein D6698_13585 [Gammaproteobacteria bacterium]|nr:MAG: hypothetical protein D6698_13585 [Gammaproteobacteria bacterium]
MNWLAFSILAYLCLLMQVGLTPLLGIPDPTGAMPNFLLVYAVYIGMNAPPRLVGWSMLLIGVLANLLPGPLPEGPILGPEALGYLFGAFAVLQLRGLVFRESVISLAMMVLFVGIFVELVVVALYSARGLPFLLGHPIPHWDPSDQLFERFWVLLYSVVVSIPFGAMLIKLSPILRFSPVQRSERL